MIAWVAMGVVLGLGAASLAFSYSLGRRPRRNAISEAAPSNEWDGDSGPHRLESLVDELVATVGHEVGNPLTTALLNLRRAEEEELEGEELSGLIGETRMELERIRNVLRTLRRLAPSSYPPPRSSEAPSSRRRLRLQRRPRMLIVDDERALLQALTRSLSGDAEVVTATSVAHALTLLGNDSDFDLVLADLMMPSHSGEELYRALTRDHPALADRMVFMTGGVFGAAMRDFADEQADRVLIKPVRREDILAHLPAPESASAAP